MSRENIYKAAHLRGVFLNNNSLYIPFSVDGGGKTYLPCKEWERLPDSEREKYWTLQKGNKAAAEITDYNYTGDVHAIMRKLDKVFDIKEFAEMNFGSKKLRHWNVMLGN